MNQSHKSKYFLLHCTRTRRKKIADGWFGDGLNEESFTPWFEVPRKDRVRGLNWLKAVRRQDLVNTYVNGMLSRRHIALNILRLETIPAASRCTTEIS